MKIVFLGTGVGFPDPRAPQDRGDTATLVDDVLIDAPRTAEAGLIKVGCGLAGVRNLLITHPHGDHLRAETVRKLASTGKLRNIAAVRSLRPVIREMLRGIEGVKPPRIIALQPFHPADFDGLWLFPLVANHRSIDDVHEPLNFLIEKDGKRVVYFLDTSMPLLLSVETLKALKKPADILIIDCTYGMSEIREYLFIHLGVPAVARIPAVWRQSGILGAAAPMYGTHFACVLLAFPPPDEEAARLGVKLARDGRVVEV